MIKTSKSRDLGGGVKAPRYGTNPRVEQLAKGKTTGIVKKDGAGKSAPAKEFSSEKGVPYQHKWKD